MKCFYLYTQVNVKILDTDVNIFSRVTHCGLYLEKSTVEQPKVDLIYKNIILDLLCLAGSKN